MINTVEDLIKELSNGLQYDEFTHIHIGYNWNMTHLADIYDIKVDDDNKTVTIIGKNCRSRLFTDFNNWKSWKVSEMIEKLSKYNDYNLLGQCNYPKNSSEYITDNNVSYKTMDELKIEKVEICNANKSLVDCEKRINKPVYSVFISLYEKN